MQEKMTALKERLNTIRDLTAVQTILNWDQSTKMPEGAAKARGRQIAVMALEIQRKWTDGVVADLLDDLVPYGETLDYESDDASLIRLAARQYAEISRVPDDFVKAFSQHTSESYHVWHQSRYKNDFAAVQPYLEKTLDFSRQYASFFDYEHIADPLLAAGRNHGLTVPVVQGLFDELREELVSMLGVIREQPEIDDSCLHGDYPREKQYAFVREMITAFGYDWTRGRMDETHHPFAAPIAVGDARITTRANDRILDDGLFATMHESGHAMYEQGLRMDLDGTLLARGTSAGVHESQSRLWENRVGRSREFWQWAYPRLQEIFPDGLGGVDVETFYKAINKVKSSLIRVQADEMTYNLHIMIRSRLSIAMLEGKLSIADLPDAWVAAYESDLGITPPDMANGVMQDVHWYAGMIGGSFEGYALGNILGAQYFDEILKVHPDIPAQMRAGKFDVLHGWLKENIYQHGSKFDTLALTKRITGGGISVQPLVRYLKAKFGDIYGVEF